MWKHSKNAYSRRVHPALVLALMDMVTEDSDVSIAIVTWNAEKYNKIF
jgi:hypothetical protein